MNSHDESIRDKYKSYLQPEQYFQNVIRPRPATLNSTRRPNKFQKVQSQNRNLGKQYFNTKGRLIEQKIVKSYIVDASLCVQHYSIMIN